MRLHKDYASYIYSVTGLVDIELKFLKN